MNYKEAKELLKFHSFAHENLNNPKMKTGFLGSLRPYKGLREENFHEIMDIICVLSDEFHQEKIECEIIRNLWSICHFARAWGVNPNRMLQRNNLIATEDVKKLEYWVETISYAVTMLLDGCDLKTAFEEYRDF